jgi:hypothetical protein
MQADIERFLARLLTDRAFRERFVADRINVAQQEGCRRKKRKPWQRRRCKTFAPRRAATGTNEMRRFRVADADG